MNTRTESTVSVADAAAPARKMWRDDFGLSVGVRAVLMIVPLVAAIALSPLLDSRSVFLVTSLCIWSMMASALNVVVGYAGQLDLSHGAFFALGAYLTTFSITRWDLSTLGILPIVIVVSLVASYLLSLVVFRAKGLHFALLTAALAIVVHAVLIAWSDVTGGAAGLSTAGDDLQPTALRIGPVALSEPRHYMFASVVLLTVSLFALSVVIRSSWGFAWRTVRDDEVLAASIGIEVAKSKRSAFMVASVSAALVGVLYAYWVGYVSPGSFTFAEASIQPLAMVIVGGAGSIAGPVVGALVVVGGPEIFRGLHEYSVLLYGVLLLASVLLAPRGVVGLSRKVAAFGGQLRQTRKRSE